MIAIAALPSALASPQARPGSGREIDDRLPPVAISTVPITASITPIVSMTVGNRLPCTHTYSNTNRRLRLCNTVAVPALVQWIACR